MLQVHGGSSAAKRSKGEITGRGLSHGANTREELPANSVTVPPVLSGDNLAFLMIPDHTWIRPP